jgi:hypothetical protein
MRMLLLTFCTFGVAIALVLHVGRSSMAPAAAGAEEKPIDYQKMAEEAEWVPHEKGKAVLRCLVHELNQYQVEVIRPKGGTPWKVTIRIVDDGKEVYAWAGHLDTGFVEQDGILYHADFSPNATGCAIVAYDLGGRKLLWRANLKGIGLVRHSRWSNAIRLERVNDEAVAVYGEESGILRYVEIVNLKTGKTVGHKMFPDEERGDKSNESLCHRGPHGFS